MSHDFDVVVIGGGIAGISVAFELAGHGCDVAVVERESSLTMHSTGRSAAQFLESYGGPTNQRLTEASRPFFESGAEGLASHPLLVAREVMWVGGVDANDALARRAESNRTVGVSSESLTSAEANHLCPALDPQWVRAAVLEHHGADIDVAELHQSYLRGARRRGVEVWRDSEFLGLSRKHGAWIVETAQQRARCKVVVNAAGAWADSVGRVAGVDSLGVVPYRRTVFTFSTDHDCSRWPLVIAADESFYFKPEGPGQILGSPADETLDVPHDVRPQEIDVALGIEAVNAATTLEIRSVRSAWAGLRSFVHDRAPVVGPDPDLRTFFWCAGQGGTGIQTAPAIARVVAARITGTQVEQGLIDLLPAIAPSRLR